MTGAEVMECLREVAEAKRQQERAEKAEAKRLKGEADSIQGVAGIISVFPSGLREDEKGRVRKTDLDAGSVATVLEGGDEGLARTTRFNDLTGRIEFRGLPIQEDRAEVMYVDLQQKGYTVTARSVMDGALKVAYENRYHPVQDYLERIEASDVTAVDLDKVASTYLGTDDRLADQMLRKTLVGLVKRVFEPGCQFDSVCVLKGNQGIRKSSFWGALASEDWFCSTPPEGEKDMLLNIHGCWIFELAELEHITTKREVGYIRNLITTRSDLLRVPYGKATAHRRRRGGFVGSVNGDTFLRDEEGSRRWWVIDLPHQFKRGELIDVDRVIADRDAIWKAAVVAYRNGELPMLDHEDQKASNERNGAYEQEHPWQAGLDAWVQRQGSSRFTTAEALIGSGCRVKEQIGRREEMEAAAVLKRLGLARDKLQTLEGNARARRWFKPGLAQPTQPISTSEPEVEMGQTADGDCDPEHPSQPTQPFSLKVFEKEEGGETGPSQSFGFEVEMVEACPENRSTAGVCPSQPPSAEVEHEAGFGISTNYSPLAPGDDPAWG
jgi:predicted P-loop ATPase